MNRRKFLSKLRFKLMWQHNTREVNNIIGDYNEYFNVGLSEGNNEYDLVTALGSPDEVVASLDDDKTVWAPIKLITRMALGGLFLFYAYMFMLNIYPNNISMSLLLTTCAPIGIWLVVGGDLRFTQLSEFKPKGTHKTLFKLMIALFVSSIASSFMIVYSAYVIVELGKMPFGIPLEHIRLYFIPLFHTTSLVGLLTIASIILTFRSKFMNTLPLLFISVGLIASIISLVNSFTFAEAPSHLFNIMPLLVNYLPALYGAILTGLSYKLIKLLDQRRE